MMSKHISGRIVGHIDPIEGAHSIDLVIATAGVTFEVGSEVDVYLGHEERLTEGEWHERHPEVDETVESMGAEVRRLRRRETQFREEAQSKGDTIRTLNARIAEIEPKPQASAELIERARALRDQMGTAACEWAARLEDGDPLTEAPAVIRDLERQAHQVVNLLAAVEVDARLTREEAWQELREAIEGVAAAHGDRPGNVIVEWSGRDWVALFEAGSKAAGGIARDPESPVAACIELAGQGHARDVPDFAGMSTDECRAWLRGRGRLAVRDTFEGRVEALLRRHNEWGSLIAEATAADEPDALLALCEAVAVKERGEDE